MIGFSCFLDNIGREPVSHSPKFDLTTACLRRKERKEGAQLSGGYHKESLRLNLS